MTKGKILEWLLRLCLGGLFVWSGVVKLQDLPEFLESVGNYQFEFLNEPYDAVVTYTLPWVEVFAGLAVISGFGKSGGLVIIMGMLASFCWALSDAWSKGLNINCGCFSKNSEPVNYPLKLAENVGIFVVALVLLIMALRMRRKSEG